MRGRCARFSKHRVACQKTCCPLLPGAQSPTSSLSSKQAVPHHQAAWSARWRVLLLAQRVSNTTLTHAHTQAYHAAPAPNSWHRAEHNSPHMHPSHLCSHKVPLLTCTAC
jgi:hypothetical protein